MSEKLSMPQGNMRLPGKRMLDENSAHIGESLYAAGRQKVAWEKVHQDNFARTSENLSMQQGGVRLPVKENVGANFEIFPPKGVISQI